MAKLTRVSRTYLIADARERAVIPFIETEFQAHAFVVRQVTTADYLICRQEATGAVVLAAIERKSHGDFAASFKDGRHENVKKLRALRDATGCKLYYFVEGPAFPSPNRRYAGIPFGNILAAITSLMVRDGVFVVQTEDEAHSAKRLADFVRAYDSEPAPVPAPDAQPAAETSPPILPLLPLEVPDILTARTEETDCEAAVCVWARLGGISVVTGKLLTRAFTVAELAAQTVTPEQIRALKTATGRPINQDAVASLIGVRAGSLELAVRLVSGMRNITPAVARLLLETAGGLSRLCDCPSLASVKLPQKARSVQFGKVRADRVLRILHYKE
jgi:ERCC4-type nuclease